MVQPVFSLKLLVKLALTACPLSIRVPGLVNPVPARSLAWAVCAYILKKLVVLALLNAKVVDMVLPPVPAGGAGFGTVVIDVTVSPNPATNVKKRAEPPRVWPCVKTGTLEALLAVPKFAWYKTVTFVPTAIPPGIDIAFPGA